MLDFWWIIWGAGFFTGSLATYLGCILFCRRIIKEEGALAHVFAEKKKRQLDQDILDAFLKEWERQSDRIRYNI